MNTKSIVIALFLLVVFSYAKAQKPTVFLVKAERLEEFKSRIKLGDADSKALLDKLLKDANKKLTEKTPSVMDKGQTPPSGSKHDYLSMATYYWADPSKPAGAPYIRKDGERNPEIRTIPDHKLVDDVQKAVSVLSLAYYFTHEEAYAKKAAEFLKVFFLDEATKMNPNMNYAQYIKGVNDGRGTGILDTRSFADVASAVGLLEGSKWWTKADATQLKAWYTQYFDWMKNSKNGHDERKAKNNHGIWFDTQMLAIGLYLGQTDYVNEYIKTTLARIPVQLELDGRQPLELARTAALSYSIFSLQAWFTAANLADNVGVDIWNYETSDRKSIKKAVDWLLPYAMGEKPWTYQQIHEYKKSDFYILMLEATKHYNDATYASALQKLQAEKGNTIAEIYYGK